jgi:hypothetical protein
VKKTLRAVALGGFLAGALDLLAGLAIYRPSPWTNFLRSIARGALGPAAAQGGASAAALGLLAHFTVATTAAAVYILASKRIKFLVDHPWIAGPIYGLGVFFFMNYVVIPMSKIGRYPAAYTTTTYEVIAAHLFLVGLPIALVARRFGIRT